MRCARFCMPEAVEGGLCLREVSEVMRCMPEAVEGGLCLLEKLEAIHGMLLCMLEAVEGGSVCGRCWRCRR